MNNKYVKIYAQFCFKAAIIYIFVLTVDEITMFVCESGHYILTNLQIHQYVGQMTAIPLNSTEWFSIFQLVVLVLQPATLQFCFSVTV